MQGCVCIFLTVVMLPQALSILGTVIWIAYISMSPISIPIWYIETMGYTMLSDIHDRGQSPRMCVFDDPESKLYNRLVPECGGVSVSYWFIRNCPM